MLVTVAGAFEVEFGKPKVHAAHIFARGRWAAPALILPLPKVWVVTITTLFPSQRCQG